VVEGDADRHRDAIIAGYHEGVDRCVRTAEWSYIERPTGQRDELYALADDPREQVNVIDEHREEADRLAGLFGRHYRARRRRGRGIQGKYELESSGLEEPILGGS
jgi:hypothetical protein